MSVHEGHQRSLMTGLLSLQEGHRRGEEESMIFSSKYRLKYLSFDLMTAGGWGGVDA